MNINQNLEIRILQLDEDEAKFQLNGIDTFIDISQKQILHIVAAHTATKDKKLIYTINVNFLRFLIRDLQKFTERESTKARFKIKKGMFKKKIESMLERNKVAFDD